MLRLALLSLCGWVAMAQDWQNDYWRNSGDSGLDSYMRLFRRNSCGYDTRLNRQREEGAQWEKGYVRYQCTNGQRVPIQSSGRGQPRFQCLDQDNNRWMSPGEQPSITPDGSFGRSCMIDSEGYMRLVTSHCAMDGRVYRLGEDFQDSAGKYWYKCVAGLDGTQVEIDIGGCITDTGRRLDVGEYLDDYASATWYYCERKESEAVAFCGRGCLDGNQRREVGDTWNDFSGATKTCERVEGRCSIVTVSQSRDVEEETYASWNQDPAPRPAPAPAPTTYTGWNAQQNYQQGSQQTYQPSRDGYCAFNEGGVLKFYLPHNSYTTTFSSEYQNNAYVVCAWNAYTSSYEAEKFNGASMSDDDIRRMNPGVTWTNDIQYN